MTTGETPTPTPGREEPEQHVHLTEETAQRLIGFLEGATIGSIGQATHLTEATARRLLNVVESSPPVRQLRASHFASAVIGSIGLALFLVGVEQVAQDIPVVDNGYGSIGVGLVLLLVTGLLLRKLG
jgi:hypothetical protein